ncbi:hypothetical protein PAE9249_02674 [Paenibacillus sp. CECT 9249]|nr:hypothetical protein PAE9249_02674 [Paenibacillus sp. CECT 9249]
MDAERASAALIRRMKGFLFSLKIACSFIGLKKGGSSNLRLSNSMNREGIEDK